MDIQSLHTYVKSSPRGVVLHMADGSEIVIESPEHIAFGPLLGVRDGAVPVGQPRTTVFVYWLPAGDGPYLGNCLLIQSARRRGGDAEAA